MQNSRKMFTIKSHAFMGLVLLLLGPHVIVSQWLSNICSDVSDGNRVPFPLDCERFVVCLNREVAVIRNCPRGLHFNRQLEECDFQWRAVCTGLSLYATSTRNAECACTCCADECNGSEVEETTPCLPEEETTKPGGVDINTDPTVTETTSIETSSNPTVTESTTDSGNSNTDPIIDPTDPSDPSGLLPSYCSDQRTDCVNKPDGSMLPVQGVCQNFIQCNHGCCAEFNCPSGLYFDIKQNNCNYPWNVDCTPTAGGDAAGEIVGPSGTTCSDQGICAGQRDGTMFSNPDTNGYFVCQCQCPVMMPCDQYTKFNETAQVCDWDRTSGSGSSTVICPDGLVYNATLEQCDYAEGYVPELVCNNTSTVCQDQPEGTLLPIEGVCNMFYKCNFNCAVEQICPNNLIYDSKSKFCDYPQNVDCPWEYTPPSGPNAGPSGISCENNGRCLGQREGTLLSSLTSCSGYTICQCECEINMECGEGLYWDQQLSTCNYAYKVNCTL